MPGVSDRKGVSMMFPKNKPVVPLLGQVEALADHLTSDQSHAGCEYVPCA